MHSRQGYYPYGETRYAAGTLPTDFHFTGQRNDATIGLYDYHARWYDPALGRFISADTLVPNPANSQDLNRYAYVRNNPLVYIDPTGHDVADFGGGNYECYGLEDCMIKSVRDPVYPQGHPKAGYLIPRPDKDDTPSPVDALEQAARAGIEAYVNWRLNAPRNSRDEPMFEFSLSGGSQVWWRKGYAWWNPHVELRKDLALSNSFGKVIVDGTSTMISSFGTELMAFGLVDPFCIPVALAISKAGTLVGLPSLFNDVIVKGPTSPETAESVFLLAVDVADVTTVFGSGANWYQFIASLRDLETRINEFSSFQEWNEYYK